MFSRFGSTGSGPISGGKWNKSAGAWEIASSRLEEVELRIGKAQDDLVYVDVGMSDNLDQDEKNRIVGNAQLRVGWHILAGRKGRDVRADIYADLVAGEIPAYGGSMKHPTCSPSNDSRFQFWVPRDFAISRNLKIIDDPKAGQETVTEESETVNPLAQFSLSELQAEIELRRVQQTN